MEKFQENNILEDKKVYKMKMKRHGIKKHTMLG